MPQAKKFIDEMLSQAFEAFPDRGYITIDWEDIPGIKYPFDYFEESGIEEIISYILGKYGNVDMDFNYNTVDSFPCGMVICWGSRSKEVAHLLSSIRAQL